MIIQIAWPVREVWQNHISILICCSHPVLCFGEEYGYIPAIWWMCTKIFGTVFSEEKRELTIPFFVLEGGAKKLLDGA